MEITRRAFLLSSAAVVVGAAIPRWSGDYLELVLSRDPDDPQDTFDGWANPNGSRKDVVWRH